MSISSDEIIRLLEYINEKFDLNLKIQEECNNYRKMRFLELEEIKKKNKEKTRCVYTNLNSKRCSLDFLLDSIHPKACYKHDRMLSLGKKVNVYIEKYKQEEDSKELKEVFKEIRNGIESESYNLQKLIENSK